MCLNHLRFSRGKYSLVEIGACIWSEANEYELHLMWPTYQSQASAEVFCTLWSVSKFKNLLCTWLCDGEEWLELEDMGMERWLSG